MTEALVVRDVQTSYGETYVLRGLSLTLQVGQAVALLGRNGAGKTTTVKSILGLTPPRAGSIVFDGQQLVGRAPHEIARLGIGYVPQGRRIFGSLTVNQNLEVAAYAYSDRQSRVEQVFDLFPELKELARRRGDVLSGGQQQILAVGRAMVAKPSLLIMDEPTEGLAPVIVKRLVKVVRELTEAGVAVLIVEQNVAFATEVVGHVYVVSRGETVYDGTTEAFNENHELQRRYIGALAEE